MGGMLELVADCRNCFGLCCVALPFTRSSDFAFSKQGGEPCHNLADDFSCRVHASLRELGMPGCTTYDCFGAGQAVSQHQYADRDWRGDHEHAGEMFEVFGSVRRLHEMAYYLTDAIRSSSSRGLTTRLTAMLEQTERLATGTAHDVLGVDVDEHRLAVAPLLREASATVRAGHQAGADTRSVGGDDLAGRLLPSRDLRAADLRGTLLIGADLSRSDLRHADLLGADLRGCRVGGADLAGALFLTQMQVNSMVGDESTRLSPWLSRPSHWHGVG